MIPTSVQSWEPVYRKWMEDQTRRHPGKGKAMTRHRCALEEAAQQVTDMRRALQRIADLAATAPLAGLRSSVADIEQTALEALEGGKTDG